MTIATYAPPQMQGALSVTPDQLPGSDVEHRATAFMTPLAGWLTSRSGAGSWAMLRAWFRHRLAGAALPIHSPSWCCSGAAVRNWRASGALSQAIVLDTYDKDTMAR